jgi:hypothetical protein
MSEKPLTDPLAEAHRISDAARAGGVRLKLTGGLGIALCCPSAEHEALRRTYADLDFVLPAKQRRDAVSLLESLGYAPDERFNAIHGGERLLAYDPGTGRQIDIFYERIQLCHRIDLTGRLDHDRPTLDPADLLLMKLQVIETNRKDLTDICAIASDHEFDERGDGVDLRYLVSLTADDWGLWKTTTVVAGRAADFVVTLPDLDTADVARGRLTKFVAAATDVPKSRRWKLRARVGERKRWYELPEEKE